MHQRHFGAMLFAPDFSSAQAGDREIQFTRSERLVLERLVADAGQVVSRERLLDVLDGAGLDSSDRNIDFVVNRLRRKLTDPARKPRFIRTQYGEGYAWIAAQPAANENLASAFLVVGPIKETASLSSGDREARRGLCEALVRRLQLGLVGGRRVVLETAFNAHHKPGPRFHLELTFLPTPNGADCVAALYRDNARLLHLSRHPVNSGDGSAHTGRLSAEAIAVLVETALWRHEALVEGEPTPSDLAPPVRLQASAMPFTIRPGWQESDKRIRAHLHEDPEDAQAQLLLAVNLHSKYVTASFIYPEQDFRTEDEQEMERLVSGALPRVQHVPSLALSGAKLLYFLGRGYRSMALEIAHSAFERATALAGAYVIFGQLQAFEGRTDEAMACYAQAVVLQSSDQVPSLRGYVEVLACQAQLAAGNREGLADAILRLTSVHPEAAQRLAIIMRPADAVGVDADAQRMLDSLDLEGARAMLRWITYISARLFVLPQHRSNSLFGPVALMRERFGDTVVPTGAVAAVPELLAMGGD